MPQPDQQAERAFFSDLLDGSLDYGAHAGAISAALSSAGIPAGATILHAACGTGRLLAALSGDYIVQGFTASAPTLAIARARLGPSARLWLGGLPNLQPPAPADAIVCGPAALGALRDAAALAAGLEAIAAALRPGGVLLLSPGPVPGEVVSGQAIMDTFDGDGVKIVRSAVVRVLRQRQRLDYFWMVGQDHRGIQTFEERVERALWSHEVLRGALSDAGLAPHATMSDAVSPAPWLYCHSS